MHWLDPGPSLIYVLVVNYKHGKEESQAANQCSQKSCDCVITKDGCESRETCVVLDVQRERRSAETEVQVGDGGSDIRKKSQDSELVNDQVGVNVSTDVDESARLMMVAKRTRTGNRGQRQGREKSQGRDEPRSQMHGAAWKKGICEKNDGEGGRALCTVKDAVKQAGRGSGGDRVFGKEGREVGYGRWRRLPLYSSRRHRIRTSIDLGHVRVARSGASADRLN